MKNIDKTMSKASSTILLAFSLVCMVQAQEMRSLSGANSPNDDTNPVWVENNTLLFSRAFHPRNLGGESDPGDVWMVRKDRQGNWGQAIHLPYLSTRGYDLPLGLESASRLLVLRQTGGINSIHRYSGFGQAWKYLGKVDMPGLDSFEGLLTGRTVRKEGILFLAGKKSEGYGNEDIYLSLKTGTGSWSELENLGNVINGSGEETGPFYDPSTRRLYFSSSSHPGATGKDFLLSRRLEDSWGSWSHPVKWIRMSTDGSDASITFLNQNEIVWTSVQSSDGFEDLRTFAGPVSLEIPGESSTSDISPSPTLSTGVTLNRLRPLPQPEELEARQAFPFPKQHGKEALGSDQESGFGFEVPVAWMVIDVKSKLEIQDYGVQWKSPDGPVDLSGESLTSVLKDKQVHGAVVSAKGYFPVFVPIGDLADSGKTMVFMTRAESGSSLLLKDVNFKKGTAELQGASARSSLSDLAKFLLENPQIKIRIHGHTDNVGDPSLNKRLSLDRAGAVRDYLVSQGVSFGRLMTSGWGGVRPIASNDTEEGRGKNRRVELSVEY